MFRLSELDLRFDVRTSRTTSHRPRRRVEGPPLPLLLNCLVLWDRKSGNIFDVKKSRNVFDVSYLKKIW